MNGDIWSWLDPRAVAAWDGFADSGEAGTDRDRFLERLHRPDWRHPYPPQFFTAKAVETITTAGLRLAALISAFPRRVFGDDLAAWTHYLDIPAEDAGLMCDALRRPRLRRIATAFMRPDLLVTDDGLRLVELNVATSLGGVSTLAPYTGAARRSRYAAFLAAHRLGVEGPDTARVWLETFAGLVREAGGRKPHVFEAVADPADIDAGRRFFVGMLRSGGYDVSCGLVHDLELTGDGAYFDGRRVDVVYTAYTWHETKRFVPSELTRQLMRLDTAGALDFIGSPAAALYDNKANLALLHDPAFDHHLTDEERELAHTHIPPTFRLRPGTFDRALAERDQLLCKPASAYGGKDLAFGHLSDSHRWRALLTERLEDQRERYVLQRRLCPAAVGVPGAGAREVVVAPLVFDGRYAGVFLRQAPPSPGSAINASSGAESAAVLTLGTSVP